MPYLVSLDHTCEYRGCASRATQRLMNDRNAPLGHYCRRHAALRLREYTAEAPRPPPAPRVDVDDAWRAP